MHARMLLNIIVYEIGYSSYIVNVFVARWLVSFRLAFRIVPSDRNDP